MGDYQSEQEQGEVGQLKTELLNHLAWLVEQGKALWQNLISDQELCSGIIAQQVLVNDKFSEFHDLWRVMGDLDDMVGAFHRFNEIDEEVTNLGNLMDDFQSKSLQATATIQGLIQTFSANRKYIKETREYVTQCDDLEQLETIDLHDFQWINIGLIPNVEEMDYDWNGMNMYARISNLVDEMRNLLSEFDNGLEHYSSSSSSTEALAVDDNNNDYH